MINCKHFKILIIYFNRPDKEVNKAAPSRSFTWMSKGHNTVSHAVIQVELSDLRSLNMEISVLKHLRTQRILEASTINAATTASRRHASFTLAHSVGYRCSALADREDDQV